MDQGAASGGVKWLLRLEGFALLAASAAAYAWLGGGWGAFALLFLVPDLGMLGYLAGPRPGAMAYNALHITALPLALGVLAAWLAPNLLPYACIWLAHIGFDRALGYGLKYGAGFKATHLGSL